MNTVIKTVLSALALSCAALAAQAQTTPAPTASTPRIDARQANQQARIAQGAASGRLTPREQHRLQKEQAGIASAESKAKADGVVTPQERAHLAAKQDRASRHIRHQKHDAQHVAKPASGA